MRPKSVDASTTRLPVLLLEPDTAYDVRVRARTALATGPWSGTARARTNPLQGTNRPQVTLDLNGVTKVKEGDGLPMRLKVTGMPNLHAGAFPERFEGEKQLSGVEFLLLDRIAKVYAYEDHPGGCGGGSFRSGALTIGDDGEVYHDSGYLVIPESMSEFGPLYVELDTRCGNTRSSGDVSIDTTERQCVEIADSSNNVPTSRTCPSGGMPGHAVDRLTARFVGVPRSHDGESEFTLRVAFIEDVGISPTSLREDALTVTGGTVTQAQRVDDRSDLFEIMAEPASDEDVTITLAAGSDCAAAGAICTGGEDPKKLYNSPTATVSGPTLTASFQGLPSQHDGETAFSFRIAFSDDIATGEEEFRDHSVEVWGGRVTRAEPVDQRRDLWEVEIEPASDDLVMVSLRPSLSCDETGAVCTAGGRRLSVSPATMVAGPSTWPVQVNGEAQVGKTLTADPSNISDRFGVQVTSMTYQWLANNARMPGASGSTYTPGEGKQGRKISVMATFTDDRGNEDTVASGPTEPVAARERNSRATGLPLISGRALVGQTLTADPSLIFDADGLENAVFSYLWEADDDSIPGATDPTYTPVQADVGKVITVIVSFLDDAGYSQSMTSPDTMAVTTAEAAAKVGFAHSLRYAANADGSVSLYWNAPNDEATGYRILRRRSSMGEPKLLVYVADTGSTATTYTDTEVTAGAPHNYRVQPISYSGLGERSDFVKLFPLRKAVNSPATGAPAVSGVAKVGETLTADTSSIVDADGLENVTQNYLWGINKGLIIGAVYGYQWLADEAEIEDATGSTYILADADEGKAIRVRVSFTDDGGHRETLTSSATAAVTQPNTPAAGLPTVSGKAQVSETLTVDTSGISDENGLDDATFTHRWITDDSVVVGAGTRAYTPTGGDQGKAVKVRVSFSDDAGNWETRTSAQTAAVEARANSPATGLPTISGTSQVGETLTADITGIADADGLENATFSYQWIADDGTSDTEITDATAQTYTPSDADAGKSMRVRVSFTDDAGNEETLTGAATDTIVTWSATLTVGEDTSVIPRTSGYSAWGMDGTLSTDTFTRGGTTYRVKVIAHQSDGLVLVVDRKLQADFTLGVGDARYERRESSRPSTKFTDAYWWEAPDWDWSAGDTLEVSLTLSPGSDTSLPELPLAPPTAYFKLTPETHNGVDAFTFRLHFSEAIATGREAFRDHSFEVTGGSVTGVERVNGLNRLWEITVAPDPIGDVTIALPAGVACEVPGAICTADGRQLHNRPEFTVAGPEPVSEQPPDGEGPPADELTAVWSATMTVEWVHWGYGYYSTSSKQAGSLYPAFFEVDGTTYTVTMIETAGWMYIGADRELPFDFVLELDGARFASGDASYQSYSYGNVYQWRGTDLSWSTGDTVKIRMLGAVDETTAGRAVGAPVITGTAQVGRTLTVDTSVIADPNGLSNVQYEYQWTSAGHDMAGADGASLTLTRDARDKPIGVRVSFTDDAGNRESLTSAATAPVIAAPLSECRRAGPGPEPRPVEVAAVPVVVESTAEKYYVLYVLHGRDDGAAVKIPVSVTLGEAGSTTLAEELPALPAERYRVEEYLVADPGDVDGDCIDDVTELAELGAMNPMNRAPEVRPVDGAAAIPDHETFEALSAHLLDLEYVKFHLDGMDTDRPVIFFQNTETHRAHFTFGRVIEAWLEQNRPSLSGDYMRGEIVYHPNVVARDGSLGVYRFEFLPHDNHDFATIAHAHEILAASMPVLEDNLMYYPIPGPPLQRYHEERALYDESRIRVLFEEDIFPDVDYIALNRAEGYGFLRVMSLEERPNPRDVVIYETLPNELSRVAGIITSVPQTPLSHVNLRAVQDGVPNAFIRDALDDDIDNLIDSYVRYTVAGGGWTLRAATPAEVDAHYAASRPAQTQTPERDLSVTQITALGDIEFGDWTAFGVKAANVAVLGTLGFPDGTVPNGFAVPFYFYDEFMKHNEFYDDIEEMLADPDFQSDFDTQEKELKKLRKDIKKGETPEWIIEALEDMHATYPEGQSLRYRSSTNNEDLPGFSGAGLYDSKTQDPEETEEDGIDKSIKGVWASLWNFRAFTEREFHRIDHRVAAMGVLVHPNYSDELANGVAVSFDPFGRRDGSYYVNTQLGEDLVTNPEAHSAPEEMLLHPDGTYTVTARSNQVPAGQLLMSDAQLDQLRRHLEAIHDEFEELYGIESGGEFAMEIEFKITSDNILSIKQARPWVFSAGQASSGAERAPGEHSNRLATGAPAIDGSARVGETLTVDIAGIADADGLDNVAFAYQWLADDAEIAGASSSTYTLADSEEGKAIKVEVTFTDDAGNEETLTSAATDAVAAEPSPNSPATGTPTINGTAQVGDTLTADTSGLADADGLGNVQYEYQWLADDAEIAGATSLTYTLVSAEEGKVIKVRVSFADDAGNEETLTSAATGAVSAAEPTEPPARPTGLSATASHDSVTLTWDDPGDDSITGYVILRRVRENNVGGEFSELVPDTGSAATTYIDNTVAAGTTYTYRIKAVNRAGTSERSHWFHIDTPVAPIPGKPTGLSATASHDAITLTWDDPGDDSITGYVILRRVRENDTGGDFSVLVANTGSAATTYIDDTVAAGTTYTYRIKAINEYGG